jgi:hypothetical protein
MNEKLKEIELKRIAKCNTELRFVRIEFCCLSAFGLALCGSDDKKSDYSEC